MVGMLTRICCSTPTSTNEGVPFMKHIKQASLFGGILHFDTSIEFSKIPVTVYYYPSCFSSNHTLSHLYNHF